MPIKITWKSVLGVVTALAGAITAAVGSGALPESVSKVLIAVGVGLVAIERIMDAIDYRTDSVYNSPVGVAPGSPTPPTTTPPKA